MVLPSHPRQNALVAVAILALAASTPARTTRADDPGSHERPSPGTLFQWSYGSGDSAGPDLDEPLVTDRPDFTESSVTVGRGVTQLEMGYTFVHDREPGASLDGHAFPDLLVRQGLLAEWLELRVGWTWLVENETFGNVRETRGRSSDLLVGFKLALTPQEGILPEMAMVPQMFIPVADDPVLGGGELLPGLNWIYAWDLSDRMYAAGSSQLLRALDDATGRPYALYVQSWACGYSVTERLGSYVEWFVFVPDGADEARTQHYLNGGLTYLISDNIQLDLRAGFGLSDAADDFFAGPGLSIRFP
ncbi:MAG: transporter [Planctomycetes bacterium]|nr:transporter [Planctomycetota bacterium]